MAEATEAAPSLLNSRAGAVSWLRLNRPRSKNSLDETLVEELARALEAAAIDTDVRVVVIAGVPGAFCSGVDLRSVATDLQHPERFEPRLAVFHRVIRAIVNSDKPVIAAVDGPAVGFGADLALACDLRWLSSTAYFEEKFVAIGLMPDGGGTFHLPRLIGSARALEHLLLGTRFDAAEALSIGLVNRVLPSAELEAEVSRVAEQLSRAAPLAVRAIKRAVRDGLSSSFESALERERTGQLALLRSEDAAEGVQAFLNRTPPKFNGR